MTERAVVFGREPGLVGVLTEPDGARRRDQAVLLLNAGILHRVGPNRLHVQVARALAQEGFPALRFDYSGHGDSGARTDGTSYERSTVLETRAAMDFLQATLGTGEFVLMGICSGADNAFRTAREDDRVVGLAMIESFAFETRGFEVDRFLRRLVSTRAWKRRLRRGLGSRPTSPEEEESPASPGLWALPPAAHVREGVRDLVERGARICFACGADGPSHYHYRRRLRRMVQGMPHGTRVTLRLIDDTDHTFTPLSRQAWLSRELVEWARGLDPADGSAG